MLPNIRQFVAQFAGAYGLPEPIVEIGALRTPGQEESADLREFVGPRRYSGWDMRPGPGVDGLASAHHLPMKDASAGAVIMLETLEHVLDPIAAMREVCRIVRPGGIVLATSQMNFPIHAYPSDYWRFTPMIFDYLLSPLGCRRVFMQGSTELPTNILGAGLHTSDPEQAEAFHAAIERMLTEWVPDEGGPLVESEMLAPDVAQRGAERDLPELVMGRVIEQSFTCVANNLRRVDVHLASRVRFSLSNVVISMFDEAAPQTPIAVQRIAGGHIRGGGTWVAVTVPPQAHSSASSYRLVISSPDGRAGNGIVVQASGAGSVPGGQLRIDGEAVDGALCFQAYCLATSVPDAQPSEEFSSDREVRSGPHPPAPSAAEWEAMRTMQARIEARLDAIDERVRSELADMRVEQQRANAELASRLAFPFEGRIRRMLGRR